MKRKPATRVFQHFPRWRSGHAEPMRRSVGTRPRSETTRTRGQRKENAIRVDSRLFAVRFLCIHTYFIHEIKVHIIITSVLWLGSPRVTPINKKIAEESHIVNKIMKAGR